MLGLMILGGLIFYIVIAVKVTSYVMNKTDKTKYAVITALIFFLFPTWDIIVGYPIFWYLCKHEAGIKIYKTVDNVEGFYIGEKTKNYEPYQPYDGYGHIDYKEQESGKYYRSYWIENNSSEMCILPRHPEWEMDEYTQAYRSGKCIVKQELKENEVSRWEEGDNVNGYITIIPFYINKWTARIMDRHTGKPLAELVSYSFGQGWVISLLSSTVVGNRSWEKCSLDGSYPDMFAKTLKRSQGVSHDNN